MLPRTNRMVLSLLLGGCLLAAVGVEAKPKTPPAMTPQARYDQTCDEDAAFVELIAQDRDLGVSLPTAFSYLRVPSMTPELQRVYEQRFLVIYERPDISPRRFRRIFEQLCLTSAARPQE